MKLVMRIIRILEFPIWVISGPFWGYHDLDMTIRQRFSCSIRWWLYLVKELNF